MRQHQMAQRREAIQQDGRFGQNDRLEADMFECGRHTPWEEAPFHEQETSVIAVAIGYVDR